MCDNLLTLCHVQLTPKLVSMHHKAIKCSIQFCFDCLDSGQEELICVE